MALLQRAFAAVRQGVLANVRLAPGIPLQTEQAAAPLSLQFLRFFAHASYLDKNEVTDRVLNVVKNFEKVDAAKVRTQGKGWDGGAGHGPMAGSYMRLSRGQPICGLSRGGGDPPRDHTPPVSLPRASPDPSQVGATSSFQKDLGLDSLDTVELVMAIEEEFAIEIPDSEADKILSCSDAISFISTHPMAK